MDLPGIRNERNLGRELIMVRKMTIAGLVLASLTALAFTPYVSLFGPNTTQVTPLTMGAAIWVEPSLPGGYTTNGGVVTLKNFASTGTLHDMTVTEGAGAPILVAGKNGFSALGFTATTVIQNLVYQTTTKTQEVFLVWAITNGAAVANWRSVIAFPASNHSILVGGGIVQAKMGSATGTLVGSDSQSKFYVLDVLFTGSNSTGYTNGVQASASIGLSSTNMFSVMLGLGRGMSVLSMFTFTNKILSTTERAAAYYYCTNRFGVMTP